MHRTVKVKAAWGKHGWLFIFAVLVIYIPNHDLTMTLAEGEFHEHSN